MKHNYFTFLTIFLLQKRILLFALLCFLGINGALVLHPQQQIAPFLQQGFQTKQPFLFKENLAIIASYFDTAGEILLKELGSVIKANYEQQIRMKLKKTQPNNNALWQSYSENKNFQVLSFDGKFEQYFQNDQSKYKIKFDEFKQAKNLLLEILRYIPDERYFEDALLKLEALVNKLETYNYQSPETDKSDINKILHETIASKVTYVQKKMIEIALIIEFKNKLFRFLKNYFEEVKYRKQHYSALSQCVQLENLAYDENNPLILSHMNEKEQKTWEYDLSIKNHFGYFSPLIRGKKIAETVLNTAADFAQDPKKTLTRLVLKNKTVNTGIQQTQITINTCNTNLLNFADIEMDKLAKQIALIASLMKVANRPAVWKFSTFLIKILPRFFINCISTQPQIENTAEQEKNLAEEKKKVAVEKLNLAVQKLKEGQKDINSVSKILEHLINATASFSPAIEFLNEIQVKVFNNAVPHAIAEYIFEMRDFLINCSRLVEEKVDILKGIRQTLESDEKNKCMAQQITAPADWAQIFETINVKHAQKFRQQFYKPTLPVLTFLTLTPQHIPMVDANQEDDTIFNSSAQILNTINDPNNASIQNHLSKVYQYIDETDVSYLQKIVPYRTQTKVDIHLVTDPEYGKILLFLASLKDIKALFKTQNQDQIIIDNDIGEFEKTNFEKIFCNKFPGTQNLKYSIKNNEDKREQEITKRDKLKPEYDDAREFLRQLNVNIDFYKVNIQDSTGYYPKRIFTKVAFQVFKLLSYFIDKEKLLVFCDKFNLLTDNIILQETYETFLSKNENLKKAAEKAVREYEKIDPLIQELNQIINEKQNTRADLKKFRAGLKDEIDRVWSLR